MKDSIAFFAGFLACGCVSSGALWSFIDAAASTKYVCTESSDPLIVASRAMDWLQAATAIWTLYLVYAYYRANFRHPVSPSAKAEEKPDAHDNSTSIVALGVFTVIHILVHVSLRGSVCQHTGCVTSESAQLARSGQNIVPYITETLQMLDMTSNDPTSWPCTGKINPDYFTMPRNACPEALPGVCVSAAWDATNAPAQPYRCMIYACNDLVPGNVRRYTMSFLGLVMQLAICAVLFYVEGTHALSGGVNIVPSGQPPSQLWPAPTLRRRTNGVQAAKETLHF